MAGQPVEFLVWIPLLPLLGAVVVGFWGRALQRRFGDRPVNAIACGAPLLAFVLSVWTWIRLLGTEQRILEQSLWTWFAIGDLHVDFAYRADPLTAVMLLVVTGVGTLIHIYSTGYMRGDAGYARYFAYLGLFVWAMTTLVLGSNLWMMFIGWEGVGLCSYLLIGFWFTDAAKAAAGMKAFIVNRIGDLAFICGGFALFWGLQRHGVATFDFEGLRTAVASLQGETVLGMPLPVFVTLGFFIGAVGKSAQIPLYVWLPDAMAGPTPVSALIHAATMVTAGVYMIGRLSFLFDLAPVTLAVVAAVGAATALFAASIALVQTDIKKVLAYSTISQLGYMMLGMGVAAYSAGIFHLVTHAFFKACLFLGAGSVIHALHHEQDIRRMGGLHARMPRTYRTFAIATLAIAGIPPLAGFWSKDEILWRAWASGPAGWILWAAGALTAFGTAFYMARLAIQVFWGEYRGGTHPPLASVHESPPSMTVPLVVLAALSIVGGWIGIPAVLGGSNPFEHFLAPVFAGATAEAHADTATHGGGLELLLMFVSVALAAGGIALAHRFYIRRPEIPAQLAARYGVVYRLLLDKYRVDELYGATIVRGTRGLAAVSAAFDRHVVDGIVNGTATATRFVANLGGGIDRYVVDGAVNSLAWAVRSTGSQARRLQSGVIQNYVLVVFVGVAAIVVLMQLL